MVTAPFAQDGIAGLVATRGVIATESNPPEPSPFGTSPRSRPPGRALVVLEIVSFRRSWEGQRIGAPPKLTQGSSAEFLCANTLPLCA